MLDRPFNGLHLAVGGQGDGLDVVELLVQIHQALGQRGHGAQGFVQGAVAQGVAEERANYLAQVTDRRPQFLGTAIQFAEGAGVLLGAGAGASELRRVGAVVGTDRFGVLAARPVPILQVRAQGADLILVQLTVVAAAGANDVTGLVQVGRPLGAQALLAEVFQRPLLFRQLLGALV